MGLKKDIEDAFIKNITPDKDNEFQMSAEGQKKVEVLAKDLSKAIIDFFQAQELNITEMEAPYQILPNKITTLVNGGATPTAAGPMPIVGATGVGSAPINGIAQISNTINKIQSKDVFPAVKKSKVKLLKVKEA